MPSPLPDRPSIGASVPCRAAASLHLTRTPAVDIKLAGPSDEKAVGIFRLFTDGNMVLNLVNVESILKMGVSAQKFR
jgi:hypothetical protein